MSYPQPYPPQPPKRSNTALWVILSVLGGIFLLCGGCAVFAVANMSSSSDPGRTSTTVARPTTARPTSAPLSNAQASDLAYVAALDNHRISYSSKKSVIELGHTVCDARRSGNAATAVALKIAEQGYSLDNAGFIVGAAQSAYCPQFN